MACLLAWLFGFALVTLSSVALSASTPLERCIPTNGMSRAMCERLVKDGCSQLLGWMGPGCIDIRGRRLRDGGCQSLVDGAYCKWKCRTRCIENDQCFWLNNECRYRGCGGLDIFDYALPEPVRSASGILGVRPTNWALDGMSMSVALSQSKLCGVQFHILSSREPDINEMSMLEVRLYPSKPRSFAVSPVATLRLYLAKSLGRGRLGDAASTWYTLRYELGESRGLTGLNGGAVYALFRFPDWQSYAFSVMASTTNIQAAYGLSCPAAFGNSTAVPLELCNRAQNPDHRVYIKLFA